MEEPSPERRERRSNLSAQYYNYDINIFNNTALVYHDSKWYRDGNLFAWDKRVIHLRKIEGEWKIDLLAHYYIPDEWMSMIEKH